MAALMVITVLPVTAIAEEIDKIGCTHHPVHTDECGYAEAAEEIPCGHLCGESCVEGCVHEHDEECGYVPAVPGSECNFHCEKCEANVVYSEEAFYFTAKSSVFAEDSGMNELVLLRPDGNKKTCVTLAVSESARRKFCLFSMKTKPKKQSPLKLWMTAKAELAHRESRCEAEPGRAERKNRGLVVRTQN